jgi:hypothetical protein
MDNSAVSRAAYMQASLIIPQREISMKNRDGPRGGIFLDGYLTSGSGSSINTFRHRVRTGQNSNGSIVPA